MKRVVLSSIVTLLFLSSGCSEETILKEEKQNHAGETSHVKGEEDDISSNEAPLSEQELRFMFSDVKSYMGRDVHFTGRVFSVEKDADGVYLQVWQDPDALNNNTIIGYTDSTLDVKEDDYVEVLGTIADEFEGENAFGGVVTAPVIRAEEINVLTYKEAIAPTVLEVEINEEISQHGYIVKVQKIEFAANETRVYVEVENDSNEKINVWIYDTKLIQGSRQFDVEYNYDADYPEIQSTINPGIQSEGIFTFAPLDHEGGELTFVIEGSSDDWEVEIQPFTFEIVW
ncbi:hypothetical protein [Alteribacter aurantiacus]|uniref:hypothetical protein n=1 Tax=Alteribacter aurantiacus TaxID=254410 RepID=UPI00041AAFF6|nr:hypothetical protein [Alteribacter aurantiacus]